MTRRWRIVCTKRTLVLKPTPHFHIVGVGTGVCPDRADERWKLEQVLEAMKEGDVFYTQGAESGQITRIERYICPRCKKVHIRSARDKVGDNDLANLRGCVYNSESPIGFLDGQAKARVSG